MEKSTENLFSNSIGNLNIAKDAVRSARLEAGLANQIGLYSVAFALGVKALLIPLFGFAGWLWLFYAGVIYTRLSLPIFGTQLFISLVALLIIIYKRQTKYLFRTSFIPAVIFQTTIGIFWTTAIYSGSKTFSQLPFLPVLIFLGVASIILVVVSQLRFQVSADNLDIYSRASFFAIDFVIAEFILIQLPYLINGLHMS